MPTPQTGTGPGWTSPLPATPPTGGGAKPATGPGTATALRDEAAKVEKQLAAIESTIAARDAAAGPDDLKGPRPSEATMIASLNARLSQLTIAVSSAEARAPAVVSGGSTADKFIVRQNPDGTITTEANPNWDGKSEKAQVVSQGNRVLTVGVDGKVTVAYTDTDAQALADRQTSVAEKNAQTAAAAQAATDYATKAKVELEQRVANGEDAASIRAEQALQLQALHDSWVRTDGDARTAQSALNAYNTERHATATEQLSQEQLQQTAKWQAQQDETTRRGQDLGEKQSQLAAKTAGEATQAGMTNARVGAAGGYAGNVMSLLNSLNKDAPPGSAAVGNMLVPMLLLGQEYFKQMAGGEGLPGPADATAPAAPAPAPALDQTVAPPPAPSMPVAPAPIGSAGDWYTQWQARQEADRQAQLATRGPEFTQPGALDLQGIPRMATGGIVTQPTVAMIGEQGPEAVVPLSGAPSGGGSGSILSAVADFLRALADASGGGAGPGPVAPAPAGPSAQDPSAMLATQAAAATGNPPAAGANPMLPGSAVPGVPPQAAGATAGAAPLGPDGSPYVTPAYVAQKLAERRGTVPAGAGG